MSLHFHLYFLPFAIISQLGCFILKYQHLHPTYQVVMIAVHLISVTVGCIRPLLGFYGNLGRKIPALSGFWIVTAVLQFPTSLFLMVNPEMLPLPLERFVYAVNLVLMSVELICAPRLIRQLSQHQVEKFKRVFMHDSNRVAAESGEAKKAE